MEPISHIILTALGMPFAVTDLVEQNKSLLTPFAAKDEADLDDSFTPAA